MTDDNEEQIINAIYKMVDAINYISRGTVNTGPCGLEAISMSIEGEGGSPGHNSLSNAIRESGDCIATSINNLSSSIDRIADKLSPPNTGLSSPPESPVSSGEQAIPSSE